MSAAVHLGRLTSGFPGCSECPHRNETLSLPSFVIQQLATRVPSPTSWLTAEGIRGPWLNQIDAAFAAQLIPRILFLADRERDILVRRRGAASGPVRVVLGCDGRSMSPEFARDILKLLLRAGCDVADAGRVIRSAFDFACSCLRPDIGLFVTGGTQPPAWTGLDVIGPDGHAWQHPGVLTELEQAEFPAASRLSRAAGTYQVVSLTDEFRAALRTQLHGLRPLRLVVAIADSWQRRQAESLFRELPGSVQFLQGRSAENLTVIDPAQVAQGVRERHADLGAWCGPDGRICRLFDDCGEELSEAKVLRGLRAVAALPAGTHLSTSAVNSDGQGRYFLPHEPPGCDALLTILKMWQALGLAATSAKAPPHRKPRKV